MPRTHLVLDLPPPGGIRVVIVDDATIVNTCLAMVLRRFGALITSGPTLTASQMFDAATPYARVSEIAGGDDEAFAAVQMLHGPSNAQAPGRSASGLDGYLGPGPLGQPRDLGFEMLLTSAADAVALALAVAFARFLIINRGGPEMAPNTPQRSEHPGQAGALLDTPRASGGPTSPWTSWHRSTSPSRGATAGSRERAGRDADDGAGQDEPGGVEPMDA